MLVALICTQPFLNLGRQQAKALGTADLPLVLIAHPLGGIDLEQVHGRAEQALPAILDLIKEHTA